MNKTPLLDETAWYAVSTRSRQEKIAASTLESLGVQTFLPVISEERQWSDRKQIVRVPLFPGYLFVRISRHRECQLRVLKVPGVVGFIGRHGNLQAVPDAEIDAVRAVLWHRVQSAPCQFGKVGDRVRIYRGVLAGIEGTLVRYGSDAKLIISVEMIRQSIAVHVETADVEPVFCASQSDFIRNSAPQSAERAS